MRWFPADWSSPEHCRSLWIGSSWVDMDMSKLFIRPQRIEISSPARLAASKLLTSHLSLMATKDGSLGLGPDGVLSEPRGANEIEVQLVFEQSGWEWFLCAFFLRIIDFTWFYHFWWGLWKMLASVVFIVICDGCDWPTSFWRTAHALGYNLYIYIYFCHHAGGLIQKLCQMSIVQNSGCLFFMYGVILPNDIGLEKNSALRKIPIPLDHFPGDHNNLLTNAQISMLRKSNTFGVDYFISKGGQATFEWPLKDVSSVGVECIRRLGMSCFTFKLQLGDRGVMETSLHDTALPAITIFQWKLESFQNHPFIFKGPRLIFHWTCQPRRPIIDRMESLCWMHCLWTIGAFRVHPKVSAGVALWAADWLVADGNI